MEATAAATPACAAGMPATAVFVIGGLTNPKPTPKSAKAMISRPSGVLGVNPVSNSGAIIIGQPARTSAVRDRPRPTRRPDSGAKTSVIAASGRMQRPACSGERWRTSCR